MAAALAALESPESHPTPVNRRSGSAGGTARSTPHWRANYCLNYKGTFFQDGFLALAATVLGCPFPYEVVPTRPEMTARATTGNGAKPIRAGGLLQAFFRLQQPAGHPLSRSSTVFTFSANWTAVYGFLIDAATARPCCSNCNATPASSNPLERITGMLGRIVLR